MFRMATSSRAAVQSTQGKQTILSHLCSSRNSKRKEWCGYAVQVARSTGSSTVPRAPLSQPVVRSRLAETLGALRTSTPVMNNRARSCRWLSSSTGNKPEGTDGESNNNQKSEPLDDGSGNSTELATLTPGQKFQVGTRLTVWAAIAFFAAGCAYFIVKELLPSKMSPNGVFDAAFDLIRKNPEILQRFGEPLKAYGRDHGGHREGRRNFVEHTQYTSKDDNSARTRVRFNLEGQFGQAFVFAEVSSEMPSGEFVYLLVQDKRNGKVITVVDNRAALTAKRMAGGSKEGNEVFQNLLSGGRGGATGMQ
mmetsp:Transcript_15357/g.21891  ORF Transcript_15357/g.21891 Transcript_15357/m.21891 type:complete len:308 (+) Transcript_15357:118-1041(+)|eukprot:CAMPEP_0172417270 /NCGR_PEP_ID=MMETSP1064-20121228/3790_1 /TAXON_ID=202472 /ORGANISM="Aulacoseira subarctica , Strain CCAP 1002/5" /LENGTH=307 /DNA_ID=CAMNT_0013155497 /DNA_START=116 /DNA_END=1039 /DNA_ORIENTATION=+